jgi:hypothetical protein
MHRLVLTCALILASSAAHARGEPRPEVRAVFDAEGRVVRLIRSSGKEARAALQLPGGGKPAVLHRGDSAGTVVAGHGIVVVGLAPTAEGEPLQIIVVDKDGGRSVTQVERPGGRDDLPFAVVATATPDGFAVFFQDTEEADPSAAHTYLVTLDRAGALAAIAEVPVPWSLAAAAWNGAGYHLALIYASGEGMRLSMVSLTADGQPQQHPDWASRPDFISDVHLVAKDGAIRAFYRGGGGTRLHERDVTAIGQWGGSPPKAKDHGALPAAKVIAIDAKGKPAKLPERAAK